uniref:Uncharacterized protein n=1 Tax=Arundo donax TaxID=35708 RepID=A0A0A9HK53_ARUDO
MDVHTTTFLRGIMSKHLRAIHRSPHLPYMSTKALPRTRSTRDPLTNMWQCTSRPNSRFPSCALAISRLTSVNSSDKNP